MAKTQKKVIIIKEVIMVNINENFKGVITPLITPFKKDFSIDYEALDNLLDFLISHNIDGFFVNATTGEFTSLMHEEKKEFAKFVLSKAKGKALSLLNITSTVHEEIKDLILFAKENVFDGIVSTPPFFLVPDSKGLYDHFKEISEYGLPTFIYNIPAATGYSIPDSTVIKLVEDCPNIFGIKITYDSLEYVKSIIIHGKEKRNFLVFTGIETYFVSTLISGGNGGVVALSNFAPELFKNAIAAFINKDFDSLMNANEKIQRLSEIYKYSNSFASAIKISLNLLGFKLETITRKPLETRTTNLEKMKEILNEVLRKE